MQYKEDELTSKSCNYFRAWNGLNTIQDQLPSLRRLIAIGHSVCVGIAIRLVWDGQPF
jgi:hypothetical protein